ncbi:HD domain-containing protein [Burkholderia sp. LMU1-1-1.1]|uniref:HD domain-containing protein n=1 Tax=Burkholderia sp. LMU1-1-1.1 TaxID=3135266 RepID=UPI003438A9AA
MDDYQLSPLWMNAFDDVGDNFDVQRSKLKNAYMDFRARVALLVGQIHKDMPSLTVHDISHIDALWWIASEIAGEGYVLNPAEAFVLGGAFLLHDSAHCIAAYPGGINEIRKLPDWKYFSSHAKVDPDAVEPGTEQFQLILFEVLRAMHPKQARNLPRIEWHSEQRGAMYLIANDELRFAFGDAIGVVAESHWHSPHELESLSTRIINAPTYLHPAQWTVDIFKLAILLRTADAAHLDERRAPRFLMALVQPGGSSLAHWQFQSRMHSVKRDPDNSRNDLTVSGNPFPPSEQDAWWMAYDACRMIDRELRAADRLLADFHRERLAVRSVAFSYSPEAFSRKVPTEGWTPVDTSIKITDIQSMVERFGGSKLYGDDPANALREILQNSVDAIHACRALGGLSEEDGEIEIAVDEAPEGYWLQVTDTGIGMSRYVLTEVLLDFGRSLWRSGDLRAEWAALPVTTFEAIGQFGIGFFSIFMLGQRVRVATRRYESKEGESDQWLLEFLAGTNRRPVLRVPSSNERLKRDGTRLSVLISKETFKNLCPIVHWSGTLDRLTFAQTCARLAPTIDINLYLRIGTEPRERIVKANDWKTMDSIDLLRRVSPKVYAKSDGKNFGNWSHLEDIYSETGQLIGRCGVQSQRSSYFYGPETGVGVVNGIYAGSVSGISGVIFSKAQTDLARKTATPDIDIFKLNLWANSQKTKLRKFEKLDENESAMLARFGAEIDGLTFGNLGGIAYSYDDFLEKLRNVEFLIVHDGKADHSDDDNVLKREFDNNFQEVEELLELASVENPKWVEEVRINEKCTISWSLSTALEATLEKVWGEFVSLEEDVVIGHVDSEEIRRACKIYKNGTEISVDDL